MKLSSREKLKKINNKIHECQKTVKLTEEELKAKLEKI